MIAAVGDGCYRAHSSASGRERDTNPMTRHASGKTHQFPQSEVSEYLSSIHISWADGDDDDDKDDDTGASGSGDGTGDASGDEGATGASGSDADTIKDPEKKRLSDEAAAQRVKARDEKSRAEAAEKKLRELEDRDRSELEKAQRDRDEAKAEADKLKGIVSAQGLQLAFFESGAAALFQNPVQARKLMDLTGIDPDDEGVYDAKEVKARADALLKESPYLGRDESSGGSGSGTGGTPNNGRKKTKDEATEAKLRQKYPALAQRG
jgi:hypothetical protein